jgi:cytochrome c-type biogenesis protein CcmH
MIGWIGVALTGIVAIAVGVLLLRRQRGLWSLLAAVVVFGLAGYAWQGSPDYPSAPAKATGTRPEGNVGLVEVRREFFSEAGVPSNFVVFADGFARQGDFGRAARLLQGTVAKNPDDGEAWLALGIALVEHAGGRVTKPAEFAMKQARAKLPGNPGPAFFDGVHALRSGDVVAARKLWVEGLRQSKDGAEGRVFVAERVLGLDRMMQAMAAQSLPEPPTADPATPLPAPQE